jgi:hypothetical protein
MRRRLHTVLVYFGFLEDRAAASPPTTFAQRFLHAFVFVGSVLALVALIEGDVAEAILLAACVLVLVAVAVLRRRRR